MDLVSSPGFRVQLAPCSHVYFEQYELCMFIADALEDFVNPALSL